MITVPHSTLFLFAIAAQVMGPSSAPQEGTPGPIPATADAAQEPTTLVWSGVPHLVAARGVTATQPSGFATLLLEPGSLQLVSATRAGRLTRVPGATGRASCAAVTRELLHALRWVSAQERSVLLWEPRAAAGLDVERFMLLVALDDSLVLLSSRGTAQTFDIARGRVVGSEAHGTRWGIHVLGADGVLYLVRPTAADGEEVDLPAEHDCDWGVCAAHSTREVITSPVLGATLRAGEEPWCAVVVHAGDVAAPTKGGNVTVVRTDEGGCRVLETERLAWSADERVVVSLEDLQGLQVAHWRDALNGDLLALGLPSWMSNIGRVELRARGVEAGAWRAFPPFAEGERLSSYQMGECSLGRALIWVPPSSGIGRPDLLVTAPTCWLNSSHLRVRLEPRNVVWCQPLETPGFAADGRLILLREARATVEGEATAPAIEYARDEEPGHWPQTAARAAFIATWPPSVSLALGDGRRVE